MNRCDRWMVRRFAIFWASWWGVLYWWTSVVGLVPFGQVITRWWGNGVQHVVLWFGRTVLQVQRPILFEATGSGDGVASWIEAFVVLLVSVGLATVWLVVTRGEDRNALRERLPDIGRSTVHYGVGSSLIVYGVIKVFALQMWMYPSMLTQTVGCVLRRSRQTVFVCFAYIMCGLSFSGRGQARIVLLVESFHSAKPIFYIAK